ncbi:type II toxin-antitoxin system ParD family antitoxin [Aliirhizobium smilacinae]|uniref:Type II toxin-antitoxin system ParD family antitoxin n=1 Tax=Aliirhizobium smilacinae TaxID=1395944 RepID=A0A5C4XRU1_9HYPH|nr:type II toxin-antitoxin system ParD family antitoxin [Rhizobium smilacinae]TNM65721.1 type II toxin-antitoxin system ParD family antitoxin [Rhizobium smilacinae]
MSDATNLGKDPEDYIEELVKSGRYENRDAALKEAVRLLAFKEQRLAELNAALARGLAESEAGLGTPIEEVMAEFEARYAERMKKRSA